MNLMNRLRRYLPILEWGAKYTSRTFTNDLLVAGIVTVMLIPQSLAYALLAGLPPEVGLYASMAPLILYAIFGTSRALAVGPVAVASLMTAAAAATIASQGTPEYLGATIALAAISGLLLLAMGLLRLGFLANFLSHPVISGFITASGIQIAAGQLAPVLGIDAHGESFVDVVQSMIPNLGNINPYTTVIGIASLVFLFWVRSGLKPLLLKFGLSERAADLLAKVGPVVAIAVTTAAVWGFGLSEQGVKIVGTVPKGLPKFSMPPMELSLWAKLLVPALLISIVGYVESISVALTLAAKRRQRVDPDQELIALGMSNFGSAVSGGFPVTGGFSRSVVNFDAGAETPAAGAFTAIGIAMATLFLTPLLYFLPNATLSATIIVAVLSLVDLAAIKQTWHYSRSDAAAMITTILLTLVEGVEIGLLAGVGLSIFLHLYRTSRPHVATVGQIPGTMNFRNRDRHDVVTDPEILSLRIDASLYFPNARFIEDYINQAVAAESTVRHVILECPAVNTIDASALESLEAVNARLKDGGITLHLSEVKGPVMDRLKRSHFIHQLTGKIHLTHFDAVSSINPELARRALESADTR
ncbi:SulP family inorganic anion transporter [Novipirellula artificiosorum]|uniref:Putative sulfate transporter n=1 Tax=Novipirellula artificiosorum TaxID=2528016 RepID=A0A5C6D6E6_9BACT|nr:sulfate permease [Novipirellula artificiosorum]TWU30816.1 putative sulfate transporter [Novipirellula artificiosorum]